MRRLPKETTFPCPELECDGTLVLKDSKHGLFYGCNRYPACRASHGAHPDGSPLGIPANAETKKMRIAAHKAFDQLWKGPGPPHFTRNKSYKWLQKQMNLTKDECHIACFDIPACQRVVELCKNWHLFTS